MRRLDPCFVILLFLVSCTPTSPVVPTASTNPPTITSIPTSEPTVTPAPTASSTPEPTATVTIEPTATATEQPAATPVALPADLAAQVDRLSEAQKTSLLSKAEDTAWKLDVYDRIREGSPNLKLTLGLWENPGIPYDVEVAYRLPSKPNNIYFPGDKLRKDHSLPPTEITEEMMKNQGVVTWYLQVITKEWEKSSGIPAGSKLARVNGDWVYLSNEGVEAKFNVEKRIFEQQVVRNAEGQIPLDDGKSVKLLEIREYTGGPYDFTEKSGINPYPDLVWKTLNKIPEGYDATVFIFGGNNVPGNDMSAYKREGMMAELENQPDLYGVTCVYSTDGDTYARLYVAVVHKIGGEVKKVSVKKTGANNYHVVFDENDPVTKDLLPR